MYLDNKDASSILSLSDWGPNYGSLYLNIKINFGLLLVVTFGSNKSEKQFLTQLSNKKKEGITIVTKQV